MLLFTSLFSAAGGFGAGAPPPAVTTFGDGNGSGGGGSSSREWAGNNMMAQRYQVPVASLVVAVSAWCNSQSAIGAAPIRLHLVPTTPSARRPITRLPVGSCERSHAPGQCTSERPDDQLRLAIVRAAEGGELFG